MSQVFETTFRCGDGEALVTYVYGESSPAERETIAAHLAHCVACADEVDALGTTRVQLAAWTPPVQTRGFQITRSGADASRLPEVPQPATLLRPAAWWSHPLPAWAQMAAAVLIFASGMAIGLARSTPPAAPAAATNTAPAAVVATTAAAPGVTREELAQVEQRLRGELAQVREASRQGAPGAGADRAVLQQVSQMIAASEARQQKELDFRTSVLVSDFSNARRTDLANIEKRFGSTSIKVLNNQQDINSLAQRVGYSPGYSPYVP